ncbi:11497_t:CDS:2, partial [Racocetra persica]
YNAEINEYCERLQARYDELLAEGIDKVMEFDKSFAREHILETLQELLPRNEMVSKNQEVTLPNQSVYSLPANSENFISKEGVAKQLGGEEVVLSPQVMPLASLYGLWSGNTGIHRKKAYPRLGYMIGGWKRSSRN